jgi:hypothetical protein
MSYAKCGGEREMKQIYFWKKASSIKEDLKRHKDEESSLIYQISICDDNNRQDLAHKEAYFRLLALLTRSKAEVVKNIGSKTK